MEKALSQPEYYPMTLNALLAGANQKSNRDPLMDLDEEAVWQALEDLRQAGLVSRVLPGPGARTDRFKHEAAAHFGWDNYQQAVMAELLLRGPQTAPELRTRCARMMTFETPDAMANCLDSLQQRDPAMVTLLPRAPGQRETRYAHTLYEPQEQPQPTGSAGMERSPVTAVESTAASGSSGGADVSSLQKRIESLEQELNALKREVAALRQALGG